jgi:hypothetical protein
MQTAVPHLAKLTLPTAVEAFARERGLAPYLPAIVEIVHRLFADAIRVDVEVHEDPEIADLRSILFEVEVHWSKEQWRHAMNAWYRETGAVCPRPLLTEFNLITYRRP